MYKITIAMAALLFPSFLDGRQKFLDNNPALGAYQDVAKCFPINGTVYLLHRNYKYDPYYGGTAKCVYITQSGPVKRDSTSLTVAYGKTKRPNKVTFLSGPGYTAKNIANFKSLQGSHIHYNLTVAYIDCPRCHVLRSDYIDGGAGCQLWVPKDALREERRCCQFFYDLLCGRTPKYQIYDRCH